MKKLAEAAGLDIVILTDPTTITDTITDTATDTVTVTDTDTDTDTATVTATATATVTSPEPVAILPPPVERTIPKHPWFGEPPARLLVKLLDAWKRRVEKRLAARLPPWISRIVARYGPASMQQRKPVE